MVEKLFPYTFLKNQNLAYLLINGPKFHIFFLLHPSQKKLVRLYRMNWAAERHKKSLESRRQYLTDTIRSLLQKNRVGKLLWLKLLKSNYWKDSSLVTHHFRLITTPWALWTWEWLLKITLTTMVLWRGDVRIIYEDENGSHHFSNATKRSYPSVCARILKIKSQQTKRKIWGVLPKFKGNHVMNFDETNLSDDPGWKKVITRRGPKYPKRVINSSKSATSLMYAALADEKVLPPYVVYKAVNMYDTWTSVCWKWARYNHNKSGWFE